MARNTGIPLKYTRARLKHWAKLAGIDPAGSTFIFGPPGTTKSHLAAALAIHRLPHLIRGDWPQFRFSFAWRLVPGLLVEVRSTYRPDAPRTESDVIRSCVAPELLVLDDLCAEKTSTASLATIGLIVSQREEAERQTIATSNLTLEELDALDPRLASRLGTFRLIGPDLLGSEDRRLAPDEPEPP